MPFESIGLVIAALCFVVTLVVVRGLARRWTQRKDAKKSDEAAKNASRQVRRAQKRRKSK
jgi:hypothetical protein